MRSGYVWSTVLYITFIGLWILEAGNPFYYVYTPAPPGQQAYLASKFLGFIAMSGFILQIALGAAKSLKLLDVDKKLHLINGVITSCFIVLHSFSFVLAVSIRSESPKLGILIPKFNDYYHTMIGLGIFAAVGILLTLATGLSIKHFTSFKSTRIHWASSSIGTLCLIHAFSIGSETRNMSVILATVFISLALFIALKVGYGRSS